MCSVERFLTSEARTERLPLFSLLIGGGAFTHSRALVESYIFLNVDRGALQSVRQPCLVAESNGVAGSARFYHVPTSGQRLDI